MHTELFSCFSFLPGAILAETAIKFLIMNVIWIPIHLVWLWAGVRVRAMNLSAGTQRMINGGMALSMVMVVGLAGAAQAR